MRYTVTGELDPELFAEVERERNSAGLSRSAAIRQALEWWVLQRKEHGEERVERSERRHRQLVRRLEYIVGMIREQDRAAGLATGRPSGGSTEDSINGLNDRHVRREGPGVRDAGREAAQPQGGALAEARKRARRRVE